ncbi:MAG: hypothetical protein JWN93_764, partial [Hyphomicrobiales bacterium]|nr:hypothetical protein [Hyphomicrobiales bacterium]
PSTPPTPAPSSPPARPVASVEEALGARWSVWIGGLALSLGALLLVRLAIEQGYFGPGVRVLMGLALSAALVAAGEFMRRRRNGPPAAGAQADIPSVLTAAGTVAAFGAIYAAHALYGFIGPGVAFAALTAAGLACMFASALHGPALAGLGLVGALGAPALVASGASGPWPLVLHTAIVTGAAYGLARLRLWLWLAVTAAVGACLWGLALQDGLREPVATFFAAASVHALVHLALGAYAFAWAPLREVPEADARPDRLGLLALAAFAALLLASLLTGVPAGQFGPGWIVFAGLGVAMLAVAGFLLAPVAGALAGAGLLALLVLRVWPAAGVRPPDPYWSPGFDLARWPAPLEQGWFAAFALLAAAGVALAAGWRLRVARALPAATVAIYAGASALTPLFVLAIAFVRMTDRAVSYPFAAAAGALALAFTMAAGRFRDLEQAEPTQAIRLALGAYASAAVAALALGLVFALDGGALTVGFALAALGAAYVSVRLDIAALRWCAAGLGLVIAARLAWEPRVVAALSPTPVFNWLLFGYGVPALAFGYAARIMRLARGEDTPVRVAQGLAIVFSALLVFFQIRHAMNGGDPFAARSSLVETGLFAVSALAFAIALTRLAAARAAPVFRLASLAAGAVALAVVAVGLGAVHNPLSEGAPVEGGRVLNGLLLAYAMPALLALALAVVAARSQPYGYVLAAKAMAIALAFGYVTLQTRRMFHHESIGAWRGATQAEWYAYSAVWLALGILLLVWGLVRGSREARLASAAFVSASVLKVFLFDLSGLEGALRALSFIGLGAVLIAIGLVYQKLVFRRPSPPPS